MLWATARCRCCGHRRRIALDTTPAELAAAHGVTAEVTDVTVVLRGHCRRCHERSDRDGEGTHRWTT